MKIVVLPGVGFNKDKELYQGFLDKITTELKCKGEVCYWKHDWPLPKITLPYTSLRKWVYEVMLDFQQVVKDAFITPIPQADYYIGHSAGSILALAQKDIPCVIMGSPACLIECLGAQAREGYNEDAIIKLAKILKTPRPVLNIINKYDQLAYYLDHEGVDNMVYRDFWFRFNTYNPIATHSDYWTRKAVTKQIIATIKKWELDSD